jgi:hypothetical protein
VLAGAGMARQAITAMPWITVVVEPPPAYAHRYRGPVIQRVLPLAEARRVCARMGVASDACSWVKRGKCYIIIPRGGAVRNLSAYRRHETAHCNGWTHGHSGADFSLKWRSEAE